MADTNSMLNNTLQSNAGSYNPTPAAADVASQRAQRQKDATPSQIVRPVLKSGARMTSGNKK